MQSIDSDKLIINSFLMIFISYLILYLKKI